MKKVLADLITIEEGSFIPSSQRYCVYYKGRCIGAIKYTEDTTSWIEAKDIFDPGVVVESWSTRKYPQKNNTLPMDVFDAAIKIIQTKDLGKDIQGYKKIE